MGQVFELTRAVAERSEVRTATSPYFRHCCVSAKRTGRAPRGQPGLVRDSDNSYGFGPSNLPKSTPRRTRVRTATLNATVPADLLADDLITRLHQELKNPVQIRSDGCVKENTLVEVTGLEPTTSTMRRR